jgi:xanthine dehydrogenase accessory factor
MKEIHRQLLEQIRSGGAVVFATVIRTYGSTPQKPGSSALFGESGLIAGTVGGGLLEAEVEQISEHLLITGVSDKYYFNLDAGQDGEGAICGGEAEVLIDANPGRNLEALEAMEQSLSMKAGGYILTVVAKNPGNGRTIDRYWIATGKRAALPKGMDRKLWNSISAILPETPGSGFYELDLEDEALSGNYIVLIEFNKPLPLLVIAGAGHVGKALAHLARLLDFEITVMDDREEFACREQIPDADHFIVAEIGSAMEELNPGPDTYIVIVTRDHHHDGAALRPLIGSKAAYVGMIGSDRKVAVMRRQFLDQGWATENQWSEIHTPIGISIGSKTVQEIAVSIAAELILVRSRIQSEYAA